MFPFVIEQPIITTAEWMKGRDPCERARLFVAGLSPADWHPGNPLSAISELDVPAFHRLCGTCGAIAIKEPSVSLVEAIRQQGIPYNNGPAIVIGERLAAHDATAIPVMIHEAAHAIEQYTDGSDYIPRPDGRMSFAKIERAIDMHLGTTYKERPWIGHGPAFIRITIHLWFRAQIAGLPIMLDSCTVAGDTYGLSHPLEYLNALESCGELSRWLRWNRTLKALVNEPLPTAFAELWQRDTRRSAADCW